VVKRRQSINDEPPPANRSLTAFRIRHAAALLREGVKNVTPRAAKLPEIALAILAGELGATAVSAVWS